MRFGLTARLAAIGASLLLALWITLIASFYWANDLTRTATNPLPEQLEAIVDLLASTAPRDRAPALQAIRSSILELRLTDATELPDIKDDMRSHATFAPYRQQLGERLQRIRPKATEDAIRRPRLFAGAARPLEFWLTVNDTEVLVAEARTPFVVTQYGLPAGVGAGLLGTLFACAALLFLHREIRPLTKLAVAVDGIDPSGEVVPLPAIRSTTPEIGALMRAFERLQTRLHIMTRSRMALIGGIQHDVRSFATRLRLRLEKLPDDRERERATADIADMIDLLDNALLTSRAGVGALDEELLDLTELLQAEIADFKKAGMPVSLGMDDPKAAWVIVDRLAFRRIIGNLVDNAVKYGQRAHVTLAVDDSHARIDVEDEGPGFSRQDADLLLEPFVRAEPSRARKTGGAGLGLAVARTLVEAHSGAIGLANGTRGGRVTVRLPLFKAR